MERADEVFSLLQRAAGGDQAAWDQLVDRFNGLLWAITRVHRLSYADGADVVQVTWMRLLEHVDRIRDPEQLGSWLATTARRECLRVLRSAGRARPVEVPPEPPVPHGTESAPELAALVAERDELLHRALGELSPRCQRLLGALMAAQPLSYAEVSAALNLPIGSIGPTRGRCLDCLRRHAARLGLADAVASAA